MTGNEAYPRAARADLEVVILEVASGRMINFTYLVVDLESRNAVLVDPAWEMDKIERAVEGVLARVRGVLITHSHFDHIHLAREVSDRYLCDVWMSHKEIEASGFSATRLVGIEEGVWRVGEMVIEAIATPGHTPGGLCYRIGPSAFTGDVLFAEGCGMCADRDGAYAMFDSLQKLKRQLSPETRVYPGHSYGKPPGQRMAEVLRDNMYLQFRDKESFAAFRLRAGQDFKRMLSVY